MSVQAGGGHLPVISSWAAWPVSAIHCASCRAACRRSIEQHQVWAHAPTHQCTPAVPNVLGLAHNLHSQSTVLHSAGRGRPCLRVETAVLRLLRKRRRQPVLLRLAEQHRGLADGAVRLPLVPQQLRREAGWQGGTGAGRRGCIVLVCACVRSNRRDRAAQVASKRTAAQIISLDRSLACGL